MIERAQPELLTFAGAVRGEEWADELALAMAACANAGWEWDRAARFACRLILTEDAAARELTEAARKPLQQAPRTPPTDAWHAARAALDARSEP